MLGHNQGGTLVIVLVILLLLTVIGLSGINIVSTDLQIAGNYRNAKEIFYECDGGMNWAVGNPSVWLSSSSPLFVNINASVIRNLDIDNNSITETKIECQNIRVTNSTSYSYPSMPHTSAPPVGSGYSAKNFEVLRFGLTSRSRKNGAFAELQTGAWKIFNKKQ